MSTPVELTVSQERALRWLIAHNGTGVFSKDQVLVAGGERGGFMTSTWLMLSAKKLVVYDYPENKKLIGTRVSVSEAGRTWLWTALPSRVVLSDGPMVTERSSRTSIKEEHDERTGR